MSLAVYSTCTAYSRASVTSGSFHRFSLVPDIHLVQYISPSMPSGATKHHLVQQSRFDNGSLSHETYLYFSFLVLHTWNMAAQNNHQLTLHLEATPSLKHPPVRPPLSLHKKPKHPSRRSLHMRFSPLDISSRFWRTQTDPARLAHVSTELPSVEVALLWVSTACLLSLRKLSTTVALSQKDQVVRSDFSKANENFVFSLTLLKDKRQRITKNQIKDNC